MDAVENHIDDGRDELQSQRAGSTLRLVPQSLAVDEAALQDVGRSYRRRHQLLQDLQQLRAESRYYFDEGARFTPYAVGGGGAAIYGNEWGAQTGGVTGFFGAGFEFQLNRTTVVGAALAYRPFLFRGWTDSANERRADRYLGFGLAHALAVELVVEVREPLARW